ncbi:hypothetical protein BFP72_06005 [Reichenbachiella sp. 5M10]|uniref:hypothetical protein n=1 Tax=Reichenbachiella sp. 5M10 TaxID=1889772 RepID=UPI000C14A8A5|nr:hypothetical protein [Reichenbachiella sp. 5M10]PIB34976.1 hypothetical protein BFP72_06005 [Reichenbachiella sp. 5M10]
MKKSLNKLGVIQRMKAPTPKFFRVLRNIGLALAAASGALLTAPVSLPAAVITAATYVAVAGGVLTAVSQATVDEEEYALDQAAGRH